MTTVPARKVSTALTGKFDFEVEASHHRIYRLYLDGQLMARTFTSHGTRELSDFHIQQMSKQMRLSRQEFLAAIECTLDRETYYALIRERLRP
jgi:Rod binding domain-containing protein